MSRYVPKNKSYLKAVEASKMLGLTINDFLNAHRNGEIPKHIFLGYGYRWSLEELKDHLEKQKRS